MHRFRIVDDFANISESLSEMSKSAANEPSLGLFYIQKHVHSAVPNLITLRDRVAKKLREITLQTEDLEDSISMVKTMEACGSSISNEMIKNISDSISLLSSQQHRPRTDAIFQSSSSYIGISQSGTSEVGSCSSIVDENTSYVSSILRKVKLKAKNFSWGHVNDSSAMSVSVHAPSSIVAENTSILANGDADEFPVSNIIEDCRDDLSHESMKYEDFRADKKANLEQWLEEQNICHHKLS